MTKLLAVLALTGLAFLGGCSMDEGAGGGATVQKLDPEQVPSDLRHLVPLAEQWGIGDDLDRGAKVDAVTTEEREELRAALEPHDSRITAWLDSFEEGQMTDEAAAFMYMQLALEEMVTAVQR